MGVGQSSSRIIHTTPLTLGRAGIVHGNIKYVYSEVPITAVTYVLYFCTNIMLLIKHESNDKKICL